MCHASFCYALQYSFIAQEIQCSAVVCLSDVENTVPKYLSFITWTTPKWPAVSEFKKLFFFGCPPGQSKWFQTEDAELGGVSQKFIIGLQLVPCFVTWLICIRSNSHALETTCIKFCVGFFFVKFKVMSYLIHQCCGLQNDYSIVLLVGM